MASASNKLKNDHRPPPRRSVASSSDEKNEKAAIPAGGLQAPVVEISGSKFRIQQAKNFAIAQAQADGCTGNYRINDSPFGNFLVPAIPTRADLAL
ncbi:hypothetical protein K1719_000263 [Acacia pycnantha]|nr:hypothetical protein K1719_000263 [Acacia pycnantha]